VRHHVGVGARDSTPAASPFPVSLFAEQRLTEPVELGNHLLRGARDSGTGLLVQVRQLPGNLELNPGRDLVLGQILQLALRITYRGPQILRGSVGLADHFAALANRRFQPVEIAHGILLARLLGPVSVQSEQAAERGATAPRHELRCLTI
jgi:hypothetical protein